MKPEGYRGLEEIYRGSRTLVYRGRTADSNTPVVIKTLRAPVPAAHQLAALRREFELVKLLDVPGVIQAIALDANAGLVLEDIGGRHLRPRRG